MLKQLPSAPESEKSIIAAFLIDPIIAQTVAYRLHPELFYSTNHQHVMQAVYDLVVDGVKIDLPAITSKLKESGHLQNGLGAYIGRLMDYPWMKFSGYLMHAQQR